MSFCGGTSVKQTHSFPIMILTTLDPYDLVGVISKYTKMYYMTKWKRLIAAAKSFRNRLQTLLLILGELTSISPEII